MKIYDVIVVGAGHAGIEAAHAATRLGCSVLLLTVSVDTIGKLSCNPAVGGVAKSHLVREVDALGGVIGRLADKAALQYRILNRSKGKAVWATRVQVDKYRYNDASIELMLGLTGLSVLEAQVEKILVRNGRVAGVRTGIGEFRGKRVVIAAGTFLGGLIHVGLSHFPGGRLGEPASTALFDSIAALSISVKRFKTGTCARLDKRSLDYSCMEEQKPDADARPFSFFTDFTPRNSESCFITYTNSRTHAIIRRGLKYSPLFSGVITGRGVRYCPSLEDKVVRFGDRDRHHIFVEPEGLDTVEVYPNGVSTSLPLDVQYEFIHSIRGFENARIIRPGYGIEHGVIDVRELTHTLEHRSIKGLYFAGQVNGTTGYEEAAAQGLVAGVNAALSATRRKPFVMGREESFIGMLIDELVSKGTDEPYRVFTSRSEFRLILREDNALFRLYRRAYDIGLIDKPSFDRIREKDIRIQEELTRLRNSRTLFAMLKRPGVTYYQLTDQGSIAASLSCDEIDQVEIAVKYEGFMAREAQQAESLKKLDKVKIPRGLEFKDIPGISAEITEKLTAVRPDTLRDAGCIPGMTPAALIILMGYIKNRKVRKSGEVK
jgi:tRNA uridine 5-carboxymethylaminomethyl modification enzyme